MSEGDSTRAKPTKKKQWWKEKPEEYRAWRRAYLEKNREKLRAQDRARYARNPEAYREKARRERARDPQKTLEKSRRSHAKRREIDCAYARRKRLLNRAYLDDLLRRSTCSRCPQSDYRCLTFHHTDPATKRAEVPRMIGHSRRALLDEVAKCEIVCWNCHLKAHAVEGKLRLIRDPSNHKPGVLKGRKPKQPKTPSEARKQAYSREYKKRRPELLERSRAALRKKYRDNMDRLTRLKRESGCVRCGEKDPVCLQFHHRDPEQRFASVPCLCALSSAKLDAELAKCDVLCGSCHKIEHYEESRRPPELRRRARKKKTPAPPAVEFLPLFDRPAV